jgi:hypothetical protein
LGKYRPASFQGPTFEAAFFRCAEAIADMDDEAAALKLADWMSEVAAIAKPPKGRVSSYVSWASDDGRIGLRWRKEAHDLGGCLQMIFDRYDLLDGAEIEGSESEITEHDDEDDEEDEDRYALSYECPCGNTWQDRWSCAVDDECDECGTVCQATIVEDE